jgi:transcriptional regulator with XRE-family HTH domain
MQLEDLASLIRFHRKQAGLSQIGLARHAGVSRNVVQDLEAGRDRTTWRNLQAVLGILNLRFEPAGPLVGLWSSSALAARREEVTNETIE